MIAQDFLTVSLLVGGLLAFAFAVRGFARSRRRRPALPINCGDCQFMVPRNRYLRRETIEDADGVVHYLCSKRFIEVTPVSPWCELGASKTRLTREPN